MLPYPDGIVIGFEHLYLASGYTYFFLNRLFIFCGFVSYFFQDDQATWVFRHLRGEFRPARRLYTKVDVTFLKGFLVFVVLLECAPHATEGVCR